MEITLSSILTIIILGAIIYFLVKFIIHPIAKIITGILVVFAVVYILKNFFGINITQLPYGECLDCDVWLKMLGNIITIENIKSLFGFLK